MSLAIDIDRGRQSVDKMSTVSSKVSQKELGAIVEHANQCGESGLTLIKKITCLVLYNL